MQKYANSVQDPLGNAIGLASVSIYTDAAHTTLATLYLDNGITPTSNPLTTNSLGEFSFYAADGRYYIAVSKTGITSQSLDDVILFDPTASTSAASINVIQSGIAPRSRSIQDRDREEIKLTDFATGDGVTDDTTGINNALSRVPVGGTLRIPSGTYVTTGGHIRTTAINIETEGWGAIWQVPASVGSSTDVLTFKPGVASTVQGIRIKGLYIKPASGTPARYGINIDGTNAAIGYLVLDQVRIDELGNYALAVTNASGLTTGTPYATKIRDCLFSGGIDLTNAGDNVVIDNTGITGSRDVNVDLIGKAVSNGGAHSFILLGCNITTAGGLVIKNAWQGLMLGGQIEQTVTSTNANNALINIQGNASANVQAFTIDGVYVGADSSKVTDSIRIDRATATTIRGGLIAQGSGVIYRITANAVRTQFDRPRHVPDSAISSFLADLGTATSGEFFTPGTGLITHYGTHSYASSAATVGVAISATQVKVNPTNGIFGVSSGAPDATGNDTGLSRISAGEWGVGTGAFASSAGHIVQTSGIDLGTSQNKRIRTNRGTALIASDFALSAGWGNTAAISAVSGYDQAWTITVTANGSGIGASPTITLTFKDGAWTAAPITSSKMIGGTGTDTVLREAPTVTTNVITFQGTPGSGSTYIISSVSLGG